MKKKGLGSRIGRYTIAGVLGHGGMGSVYRVKDPEGGKTVALKLLNPSSPLADFLDKEEMCEIFITEIQTMSRLRHVNIAKVLDSGLDNEWPFYTMEYFCNDLGMLIGEKFIVEESSRRLPPQQAVDFGCQVLDGLQFMHDQGVMHRDIKPYNMMLSDRGMVKICDFGMARLESEESFNAEGINIGSPYYTAPEQIRDAAGADYRADLYSAGVMIYRMLTGVLPSMGDFMLSHVDPLYDPAWDAFFAKALNWKPDLRFQDAGEMADEFTRLTFHWERKRGQVCPHPGTPSELRPEIPLRIHPVRVSGTKARETFGVDRLWQPATCIKNMFTVRDEDTVLDEATGLLWQRVPSDSPMDRKSADAYIEMLNDTELRGIHSWRLPTVNELMTLFPGKGNAPDTYLDKLLSYGSEWFWSCDRRSPETSWYFNAGIGYAGWQHDSCLYSVRGVASTGA